MKLDINLLGGVGVGGVKSLCSVGFKQWGEKMLLEQTAVER